MRHLGLNGGSIMFFLGDITNDVSVDGKIIILCFLGNSTSDVAVNCKIIILCFFTSQDK